jgi:hypothetical protein
MAFRKIAYLIPSCDSCGLAWSFGDPACEDGIPPHFASRAAAVAQLPSGYGWQITRIGMSPQLMACRRCAAARALPATAGRAWLLAAAGRIRRVVPFGRIRPPLRPGLGPGHPESMTTALPAEQEGLLMELDPEIFPNDES